MGREVLEEMREKHCIASCIRLALPWTSSDTLVPSLYLQERRKKEQINLHFIIQRTLAADLGINIEYLATSTSSVTEKLKLDLMSEYVKVDLYYQTLNVKTVEEEPVYSVT